MPSSTSTSSSSPTQLQDPEVVGSLFSVDPEILQPYMGLGIPAHADDPWYHKRYNLHRPIYSGDGSYEKYLRDGRYRRHTAKSPKKTNVLTPSMLDRLLRIRKDFEKKFPQMYKAMLEKTLNSNRTRISIKPPVIPLEVTYPALELAAAEKDPSESPEQDDQQRTATEGEDFLDYFQFDDADE